MGVFSVGPIELLVILLVILLVFGPDQLSDIARRLGKAQRDIQKTITSINDEMLGDLKQSMDLDKAMMSTPTSPSIGVESPSSSAPSDAVTPPLSVESSAAGAAPTDAVSASPPAEPSLSDSSVDSTATGGAVETAPSESQVESTAPTLREDSPTLTLPPAGDSIGAPAAESLEPGSPPAEPAGSVPAMEPAATTPMLGDSEPSGQLSVSGETDALSSEPATPLPEHDQPPPILPTEAVVPSETSETNV